MMRKFFTQHLIALAIIVSSTMAAQATTYYVDVAQPDNAGAGTTWATAKRDLQEAINAATSGDQIWVAAGIYKPTHDPFGSAGPSDNRDKTFFLKDGVALYGGFLATKQRLPHGTALLRP